MQTFQELYDGILHRRDIEKVKNPIIIHQVGELGFHIYANAPLQFNIMYGNIHRWQDTKQDVDIKFVTHQIRNAKIFRVSTTSSNTSEPSFRLSDNIELLFKEFPYDERIGEITSRLLAYSQDDL